MSTPSTALTLNGDYAVSAATIDAIQGLGEQYEVEAIFLADENAADGTLADTIEVDCALVDAPGWFRFVVALEPEWQVVAQAEAIIKYERVAAILAIPC